MAYITEKTLEERLFGNKTKETFTATAGQTVFNLTNQYMPGTNTLSVFVNGVRAISTEYVETSANVVTFAEGLVVGDIVEFVVESVEYSHRDDAVSLDSLAANTGATLVGTSGGSNLQTKLNTVDSTLSTKMDKAGGDFTGAVTLNTVPLERMQFFASKNTTSGTSVDFSPADGTGIPSWAKRVTIVTNSVSLSGTDDTLVRLGTSSGVLTTGYSSSTSAVSNATASATAGAYSTAGFLLRGAGASLVNTGHFFLTKVPGTNTWIGSGVGHGGPTSHTWQAGGSVTLSGDLDRIIFTTSGSNTFDGGSVFIVVEG